MPSTVPSGVPLRELLEQRRLVHRDRRLAHVIGVLRMRADGYESTAPRSLLEAIAGFSRERAALTRRMRQLDGDRD